MRTYRKRQDILAKLVFPSKQAGLGVDASFSVRKVLGAKFSFDDTHGTGKGM